MTESAASPTTPTHVVITTAPLDVVLGRLGEEAPVGRLDGWTVAALSPRVVSFPTPAAQRVSAAGERVFAVLDTGHDVGLCVATGRSAQFMVWSPGWQAPSGKELDRFAKGWRQLAHAMASLAGHPENAEALAQTLDAPGFQGHGMPLDVTLDHARALLGVPASVMGISADSFEPLTDVAVAAPRKRGLFGRR
ncbi:hypothetical protein [Phycicoccus avicenniae]|uniref:hypothetical protein n=1 Tax=Phycicoccus avicenniae TaxID=2828860 RepID=UPI003D2B12EA